MASIDEMLAEVRKLEAKIEGQLEQKRREFDYTLTKGRVKFRAEVRLQHRALRIKLGAFLARTRLLTVLTAPFIYSVIVGFLALDLLATLYQAICFPVYGISKVRRRDFIIFDRRDLGYLNGLQKLNCFYCSYGNGLLAYVSEIAGRTEQYWCPIKHAQTPGRAHSRYPLFLEFGDAENFQDGQEALRAALVKERIDEQNLDS